MGKLITIVVVMEFWADCVKEANFVSKELDSQGFFIKACSQGKFIVSRPKDDTHYKFEFYSMASYPNCVRGLDFFTTRNTTVSFEDLQKEAGPHFKGIINLVPKFEVTNERE
jgi:hypothetical protein